MSTTPTVRPTTWEAFWMHIDEGKTARFDEKISRIKITKSSYPDWYYFDFDYELADNDGDGILYEYTRKMLQAWLDGKFQPSDWEIGNE